MADAAGNNQYDNIAKNFLSNKSVIARILKGCAEEFKSFDIETIIAEGIEKEPEISKVRVDRPLLIQGENVEDSAIEEGTVFYDIRVDTVVPGTGHKVELIINLEAQKDKPSAYPLTKRGLYYCSRMISAQKNTRFTKSDYGEICKVYSIWIIMNPDVSERNSITEYRVEERQVVGNFRTEKRNYDLMSMVVISLGDAEYAETELLQLLDTVFVSMLPSAELKEQLSNNFDLELTPKMEKEVSEMCNLSIGIEERGIEKGIEQGIEKGIDQGREKGARETNRRLRDLEKMSVSKRAILLDYTEETIKAWDENDVPVLA